ncbi:MAG: hypothetical protein WBX22_03840, partial [Silvibacterium sp.]
PDDNQKGSSHFEHTVAPGLNCSKRQGSEAKNCKDSYGQNYVENPASQPGWRRPGEGVSLSQSRFGFYQSQNCS